MNRYRMLRGSDYREPQAASGWQIARVLPASGLYGANGMQFGPDGRLYVAQALGSQITAIDVEGGSLEVISPLGGAIVAPDDVAFDSHGTMYVTEVMSARVCARTPDGKTRIVSDRLPGANGITVHNDRVFVDEFRDGGRIFELYPHSGRAPRMIADGLCGPNALMVGPDGKLYFPLVPQGEVWRVDVGNGKQEKVVAGLKFPTAVKFSRKGELTVPQSGNGEVVRIDLQSGARTIVARVRPGIDNFAFHPDNRMFVSHFVDGGVAEVASDGSNTERSLVPPGLLGPWGIACGATGQLYLNDGLSLVVLAPDKPISRLGGALDNSFPAFVRSIAAGAAGELWLTTVTGDVVQYFPDGRPFNLVARELKDPYGIACLGDGTVAVTEAGTGKLLRVDGAGPAATIAEGFAQRGDVIAASNGTIFVSDVEQGRVTQVDSSGKAAALLSGLEKPYGLALRRNSLLVLDRGTKQLHMVDLTTKKSHLIAHELPVGDPPGCSRGPMECFGGLAVGSDGTIYIAGDGEGSILTLRNV
ncbi:MAG: gluconolaconase [Candidatus Binatia bacterium]